MTTENMYNDLFFAESFDVIPYTENNIKRIIRNNEREEEAKIYEWKIECLINEGLTMKDAILTLELGM